jgi:hypothetical protein
MAIALPPIIAICMMITATGGEKSSYYAGLNLVLVGLSMLWRWSFWNSLIMVMICLASYYVSVMIDSGADLHIPSGQQQLVPAGDQRVRGGGNFFYERLRFQEFALRTEVERSRELLESRTASSANSTRRRPASSPTSATSSARR